eukprot:CAMPEP_0179142618 /NCGR_PEP_ID=MMETSP0796-20121207/68510_1 /TAXON_ID=73915 /ORGANISM="Pyrodinium bahamense, Strain pbaha01" /LENGTH=43 /DNA_ID= /DNA_START= /DNA_END= /DNA_ORIENTATION=
MKPFLHVWHLSVAWREQLSQPATWQLRQMPSSASATGCDAFAT